MLVNTARSVSEALHRGLHLIRGPNSVKQSSRVGDVLVSPSPVMTVYQNPENRVLFSAMRDANPFFHVMETLWMLAGRNDLPWLTQFNKKFAAYSDDGGKTQPGAYGYRWRRHFGHDQLMDVILELKRNPETRRCVLAMWDGGARIDYINPDKTMSRVIQAGDFFAAVSGSADVPCNTHAYFDTIDGRLNMTVCCRSNDIIWGAYGANAVHFSFLLEFIATATGIPMGVYRQFSNNFHLYTNIVPEEQLMPLARDVEKSDVYLKHETIHSLNKVLVPNIRRIPLMQHGIDAFEEDLTAFMEERDNYNYREPFFEFVAKPMYDAHWHYREKRYDDAILATLDIRADDWSKACVEWLQRRKIKHELNKERFTEVTSDPLPHLEDNLMGVEDHSERT